LEVRQAFGIWVDRLCLGGQPRIQLQLPQYPELCRALDALNAKATEGNVQALRELRAWIELSTRLC
jgi:hypothetical protein